MLQESSSRQALREDVRQLISSRNVLHSDDIILDALSDEAVTDFQMLHSFLVTGFFGDVYTGLVVFVDHQRKVHVHAEFGKQIPQPNRLAR